MTGNPHPSRIIVLGASGKLGRMVCRRLARIDPVHLSVSAVFRGSTHAFGHIKAVQWAPGQPVPQELSADVVVALWGVTDGDKAALAENTRLAKEAQAFGHTVGANRVLHCSSVAVYAPGGVLTETAPTIPVTPYGQAKLAMEQWLADGRGKPGPQPVCLRIGNVAGADSLFGAGHANGQISLDQFSNGQGPRRSYIAPQDLTDVVVAMVKAAPGDLPFAINLAAPGTTAMADLAREMGWPVTWRAAPPDARQVVQVATDRLAALWPLRPESATAQYMVRDLERFGDAS